MKILHLICTNGIAGAEKHLNYLLPGMAAYNYECHLIIVHPALGTSSFSTVANLLAVITGSGKIHVTEVEYLGKRINHRNCKQKKQGFSAPDESWYRGENATYVK